MKFPLYEFFRPLREYFLALRGVYEYFSLNFPIREYIFFYVAPLPPISFLMAPSSIMNMHNIFTCLICINGEHHLFIKVNYAMHAKRLKEGWKGIFLLLESSNI